MEPLPNVNRIFSLVLQQERQITRGTIFDGNVVNTANAQGHWKQTGKGNMQGSWKMQGRGRARNPNHGK